MCPPGVIPGGHINVSFLLNQSLYCCYFSNFILKLLSVSISTYFNRSLPCKNWETGKRFTFTVSLVQNCFASYKFWFSVPFWVNFSLKSTCKAEISWQASNVSSKAKRWVPIDSFDTIDQLRYFQFFDSCQMTVLTFIERVSAVTWPQTAFNIDGWVTELSTKTESRIRTTYQP